MQVIRAASFIDLAGVHAPNEGDGIVESRMSHRLSNANAKPPELNRGQFIQLKVWCLFLGDCDLKARSMREYAPGFLAYQGVASLPPSEGMAISAKPTESACKLFHQPPHTENYCRDHGDDCSPKGAAPPHRTVGCHIKLLLVAQLRKVLGLQIFFDEPTLNIAPSWI
jgi:hypothetical protein